ncbi:hypothetical protein [Flavobacterium sp. B17]|uniref:hypothetical protein n=1 Tax=Flavobacterium sp. B17 TaxID=95618 RepID=UPI0003488B68|nr:hypothetical protein [Flavobacterium sp. B17]
MKILYGLTFLLVFSCSEKVEDRCFASNMSEAFQSYTEKKPFTVQQILEKKPNYLEIINLKKYRSFKEDSIQSRHNYESDELSEKRWKVYQHDYRVFKDRFSDQFSFLHKQQVGGMVYALGTNELGFWLLKIEGNGSMDFHEVFYKSPRYDDVKSVYVQRHNLDNILEKFKQAYH